MCVHAYKCNFTCTGELMLSLYLFCVNACVRACVRARVRACIISCYDMLLGHPIQLALLALAVMVTVNHGARTWYDLTHSS